MKDKRNKDKRSAPKSAAAASTQRKKPKSAAKKAARPPKAGPSLRVTESLFRETFDLAAVGIGHLAPDGRWLRTNRMLCEILGCGRSELLERSLPDLIPPEDRDEVQRNLQHLFRGAVRTSALEVRAVRKDGF